MTVKTALQLINRELDEYLGGIQGDDARRFEQNGLDAGDYGTANPRHSVVTPESWKASILKREATPVGMLPPIPSVGMLPASDTLKIAAQRLEDWSRSCGSEGAYCLYDICANKRRNAAEAASYGLIEGRS